MENLTFNQTMWVVTAVPFIIAFIVFVFGCICSSIWGKNFSDSGFGAVTALSMFLFIVIGIVFVCRTVYQTEPITLGEYSNIESDVKLWPALRTTVQECLMDDGRITRGEYELIGRKKSELCVEDCINRITNPEPK